MMLADESRLLMQKLMQVSNNPTPWLRSRAGEQPNTFLERLGRLGLVEGGDFAALDTIFSSPVDVPAKKDFVAEDHASDRLHVLLDGWACRYRTVADGRRQIVTVCLPGDILDIDRLYLQAPGCGLASLSPCRIASVHREDLFAQMDQNQRLATVFGLLGAADNALLAEHSVNLGRRSAHEHLAHLMCEIMVRLESAGLANGLKCAWPITQEQIADILGLTPVHVNRTMRELRARELIEISGQELHILDREGLERSAGFDSGYLHLHGRGAEIRNVSQAHQNFSRSAEQDESMQLRDREIAHRFKNLVGVAQALVHQSLRSDVPVDQVREALLARLAVLGTAIDALTKGDWRHGQLKRAIQEALILHEGTGRINCSGPDLKLTASALTTIALALHELQTNALKYGALSTDSGSVELLWKVIDGPEGPRLWMQWAERGGPEARKPTHTGFGSRLIAENTARALSGETMVDFTPEGLTWLLLAPLGRIAAKDDSEA
jgi:two-component sensor histidine kinase